MSKLIDSLMFMYIVKLILQFIFYYLLLCIFIYFVSDFAIFPVPKHSLSETALPQKIKISTADGNKISAIYLENPQALYTILFSHGNAEDLNLLLPFFETMRAQGFSVFAYDYHGYGSSEGRASEKNTYLDIQAAYDYVIQSLKIPADHIILYGRSLGTGPTVNLASKIKPAGVILESAMLSAYRVVTMLPILILDKYPNYRKIKYITSPILFIHGNQDAVIPFWHGKKLFDLAVTPKKYFYVVENAGHNDLLFVGGGSYWEAIKTFANSLQEK